MNLVIQKLINSIIQIVLFAMIPFIWWLISGRKEGSFFEWIGLKRVKNIRQKKTIIWVLITALCFFGLSIFIIRLLKDTKTATSAFSGAGMAAIPAILIYAVLNTALPEELLFRGFMLKRIANKFGFAAGNLVQSIVFGLMHGVMFFRSFYNYKESWCWR